MDPVEAEEPGQAEVVVRGTGAPAARVRLYDRAPWDADGTVFTLEAVADGVCARLENVTVSVWDDLAEFFGGLARDFRGWDGKRVWVHHRLVVTAVFGAGGHVRVTWALRSGVVPDNWTCTVTTVIEAGEAMAAVAADLRAFLDQEEPRPLRAGPD